MKDFQIGDHWLSRDGHLVRIERFVATDHPLYPLHFVVGVQITGDTGRNLELTYDRNGDTGVAYRAIYKKETDRRKILKAYLNLK